MGDSVCQWCGKPLAHTHHGLQRYCSDKCKYQRQYAGRSKATCRGCGKRRGFSANDPRAEKCSGLCRSCQRFPCGTLAAYRRGCRCADCRKAAALAGALEYARGRRWRYIDPKARIAIYERDNWTCQLCGDPVDLAVHHLHRDAPTLDHIEPQSAALIPNHDPSNLRTAHRKCNSKRGNRMEAAA